MPGDTDKEAFPFGVKGAEPAEGSQSNPKGFPINVTCPKLAVWDNGGHPRAH